jgi:branched-chain amino acid transport system substrate-binding protein
LGAHSRIFRLVVVVGAVGLVVTACSSKNGSSSGTKNVSVAFQGALTGGAAGLVVPGYQAAKMAFNAFNSSQSAVKVTLVGEDTQGDPTQAPAVANKVANDPSFVGVIGPAFSGESIAAGPIYDAAGIPFMTASATRTSLNQQGWSHWFRANANDDEQGPAAADYIGKVMKPNCAYVTSDDSAYGQALATTVASGVAADGVKVTSDIKAVTTGQTDFSALITKVQASGCTAMFYGGYSPEAGPLRKQMTDAGLNSVTMVGGDGIKDSGSGGFTGLSGAAGEGTIATCPCVDITQSTNSSAKTFASDYQKAYNTPPGIYSAEYYDVAQMFIAGFKAGHTTRAALTTYFSGIHYTGITKSYTFLTNHELNQSDVTIFIWKDTNGDWAYQGKAADLIAAAG